MARAHLRWEVIRRRSGRDRRRRHHEGETRILGLVQAATDNKRVCASFLRELLEHGFQMPTGLLVLLDGAKGLSAAVREVPGERVPIQYFQWHKRDNVLSYPPKTWHAPRRRKLQVAYAEATYAEAQHAPPAARQGTPETQGLRRPEPWRRP